MSTKKKRPYKLLFLFLIAILLPVSSLIALLLYKPPTHFPSEQISSINYETSDYALTFENQDGIFVNPTIDILYHTIATYFLLNGTNPFQFSDLNHENISHYLLTHQNPDGGHSDSAGSGNMHSSYQVIFGLNWSSPQHIVDNPTRMNLTIDFVNNSYEEDGGYSPAPFMELPEEFASLIPAGNQTNATNIQSTYEALEILAYFGKPPTSSSQTTTYINSSDPFIGCRRWYLDNTTLAAGYVPQKENTLSDIDLHSTYYGVAALFNLGYSSTDIDKWLSNVTRFILKCNNTEGGFAPFPGNESDVTSTYYGVAALTLLKPNFATSTGINTTKIIEFISNSQNADGGIGACPGNSSSFQYAHHAVATLKLLGAPLASINLNRLHDWFKDHRAENGLYGEKIVEGQYWGIESANLGGKLGALNITSLANFLKSCQNTDGGFGTKPNSSSSVIDTYHALESLHLIDRLSVCNRSSAIQWLQSLQTLDGGFTSKTGMDAFIRSYSPMYADTLSTMIDDNKSSTHATYFALAALSRLDARPLNGTSVGKWLLAAQNPDGGFPYNLGIRSDAMSTYYGVYALALIGKDPYSSISCIEFLKGCQMEDGGFTLFPMLSGFMNISYLFVSYCASKALYLLETQPSDVFGAMDWLMTCKDERTNGYGDTSDFGADLRNAPYLIDIVGELNIDRSFYPDPWIQILLILVIAELVVFGAYGVMKVSQKILGRATGGVKRTDKKIEEFPAVHVKSLTIKIGKKVILEDVSMTLHHGEVLGVIGESGAGKSTFVKCILGTRGSMGDIRLYGYDIRKQKKQLKPLFGYVPQDLSKIYENFTVMENLMHFGKQYGLKEKEIVQKGSKILRDLGILDKKDALVSELSGGQRRRASIAVGMIHSPVLFVLDEPTSGLDPIIREQLWINLIDLAESRNTTLIVITHYPEESKFCSRVAIFGRKRGLIDFGDPQELIKNLPGTGRAIDINLKGPFENIKVDFIPILQTIPEIEFALEEKRGQRYRIFSALPLTALRMRLIQTLGTALAEAQAGTEDIELKQSDANLVDYFRIKSLEVKD